MDFLELLNPEPIVTSTLESDMSDDMEDNSPLCAQCQQRLAPAAFIAAAESSPSSDGWSTLYNASCSWDDLQSGTASGCALCKCLVSFKSSTEQLHEVLWEIKIRDGTEKQLPDFDQLRVTFVSAGSTSGRSPSMCKVFDIRSVEGSPAAAYISNFEFDTTMGSAANLQLLKDWDAKCINEHPLCVNDRPVLPTRVLDLGSGDKELRLLATNGAKANYCALSYCWGGDQPYRLTNNTLDAMLKGINFDQLPTTIQDAVTVTRALGICYLWIDAFCIIQDNDDDKTKELKKMAQIYKDSFICIIAAKAPSSRSGFLASSDVPEIDLKIRYGMSDSDQGQLILRDKTNLDDNSDFHLDFTEERAWCFQESLLGRRCISYSKLYLHWSCQQTAYANKYTQISDYPLPPSLRHYVQRLPQISQGSTADLVDIDKQKLNEFWTSVIQEYSYRSLTSFEDKLPAVSAIAAEFQTLSGYSYLAGLWEQDIAKGLLWYVDPTESAEFKPRKFQKCHPAFGPRPNSRLAPTWSWASIHGQAHYMQSSICQDFQFLGADATPRNQESPFGALKSPSIMLRGRLKHAILHRNDISSGTGRHYLTEVSPFSAPFGRSMNPFSPQQPGFQGRFSQHVACHEARAYPDVKETSWNPSQTSESEVWCLEIGTESRLGDRIGLILRSSEPGHGRAYERVGFFVAQKSHWFADARITDVSII
ncbi:hypothetical protein BP6252_01737 [Coleophoma cylindrospora]|uniref:Heterokaryon incompatibility domain-containing protein n=1 Tax=Coleophoma cylindrospora TaxID=1849047 RepID=A0A3D8STU1_9HELO|nr:hypothetical protein BP6252_01737 [Coleophoma cylindrospora]